LVNPNHLDALNALKQQSNRRILKVVTEKGLTTKNLFEALPKKDGLSETSLSEILKKLEEVGLLIQTRPGHRWLVNRTVVTELLLSMIRDEKYLTGSKPSDLDDI